MNTTEERVEGELVTVAGAYLVAIDGEDSLVAHGEEAALCVVDDSVGRVLVDAWHKSDNGSIVTVYFGSTVSSTQVRMKRSRLRRLGAEVLPLDVDRARAAAERRRS